MNHHQHYCVSYIEYCVSKYAQRVWYQILGEPMAGKTLLAAVLTQAVRTAWVVAPQEENRSLWAAICYAPDLVLEVETLPDAFEALRMLHDSGCFDALVLDSVASFEPGYGRRWVAKSIKEGWFRTRLPIYLINQLRYPKPPGGVFLHSSTRLLHLRLLRRRPFHYAFIGKDWLIWNYRDQPRVSCLTETDRLWTAGTVRKERS